MSLEKALADLERKGFLDHVMELEASTATAAQAAEVLGVEPGRIAKTMSFLQEDKGYGSRNSSAEKKSFRPWTAPGAKYAAGTSDDTKAVYMGKQFSVTKAEHLSYQEGDRVKHVKFGDGTVISITEEKRDYAVTVNFDRAGIKRLYATFAKLKKI